MAGSGVSNYWYTLVQGCIDILYEEHLHSATRSKTGFFFLFVFLAKQMSSCISGMGKNMIYRGGLGTPKLGLNLFLQSVEDLYSFPPLYVVCSLFSFALPLFWFQICWSNIFPNGIR